MGVEATRNSFRAAVIRGEREPLVVTDKNPLVEEIDGVRDALGRVVVPRSEVRRGNHRGGDRHRLNGESAAARWNGEEHQVEVINLSSGGAMLRCGFEPRLWDLIDLQLGEGPSLEGAVRWLKGDFVGIEFAHETRIDCDPGQRDALLLEVIQRSFPDQHVQLDQPRRAETPEQVEEPEEEDLGNRGEKRHPLIWMGEIHYAYDSNPVRLRNVSEGGVLIEVATDYPVGAEVLLDLGDAGQFFGTVQWAVGDQVGLRFVRPFDISCLAKARPDVTPHSWTVPTFLEREADESDSPWHFKWRRSSIAEIRDELEGYLKH